MVIVPRYHVAVERTDDNRYIASNSRRTQLKLTGPARAHSSPRSTSSSCAVSPLASPSAATD